MKKLFFVLAILTIYGLAVAQQKGKVVTIVGEVVETQCYVSGLTGPGKGPGHKECALKCAKQGIPLSILEDKTGMVFLAGQTKKAQSGANEMLIPFIAQKVNVTGRLYEKGGLKLILISKVSSLDEMNNSKEGKK